MVFVAAFEMSIGPILWIYLAEICTDAAISLAVGVNWVFAIMVGFLTPYMLNNWLHNYTFLLFAFFCFLALLFVIVFVKETKGKSEAECKLLYSPVQTRKVVDETD